MLPKFYAVTRLGVKYQEMEYRRVTSNTIGRRFLNTTHVTVARAK